MITNLNKVLATVDAKGAQFSDTVDQLQYWAEAPVVEALVAYLELFDKPAPASTEQDQAAVIDLPAAGALFHHCQTLHYTPANKTERQSRAFANHFMPPGTRSGHTGEFLEVSFGRPMLRMRT